jgi:F0F1-type ATP synthase epsilon subunit
MAKKQDASTGAVVEEQTDIPKGKFHLKVYAPFKVYYEGIVTSISAENGTGPFDILANHHNFLTLLSPCELIIRAEIDTKEPEKIQITRGIMQVKANDVIVFLDV